MFKSLFGLLHHRMFVAQHHHLWQVTDGDVVLYGNGAAGGLLAAAEDFQECRFAGTVLADERDAVLLVYNKRHVRKKRTCAEFYTEIVY